MVLTPGAMLQRFQRWKQHGLRVAWHRDVVRKRILRTRPITGLGDLSCETHVMTSAGDWLNLVWALKTFYHFSRRRYALCIHDDGTVPPRAREVFRHHFPDARYIDRPAADALVLPSLARFPRCLEFRRGNHLSPKVFDFAAYLKAPRMFLVDSDVIFFAEPTELLRRIDDPSYMKNSVNGDIASAYTVTPEAVKAAMGFDLVARFNSGLGVIHKESLRTDWVEEFLGLPGIVGHFWRIEQTLYALCSSRFGCELLPPEYDVRLTGTSDALPSRHYIGAIRHLLYGEAIARLNAEGFLRELGA